MEIVKPAFIVGMGRCGSTIVFEALSVHEELGWLSNYNKQLPGLDIVSIMPRIYHLPFLKNRMRGEKKQYGHGKGIFNKLLPTPFECYTKWERLIGEKFLYSFLRGEQATKEERRRVHKALGRLLRLQGKPRFAAKLTGPTRMTFLNSIFPDAKFVHVTRDARAVIYSLLNIDWWTKDHGRKKPMWRGGLPRDWQQQWKRYGHSAFALTAMQYRAVMDVCAEERQQLASERYMEIRYEDFVADPQKVMKQVQAFYGLQPSERVSTFLDNHHYKNQNGKYLKQISDNEHRILSEIIGL